MFVKALESLAGVSFSIGKGEIINLPEPIAKSLIKYGQAVPATKTDKGFIVPDLPDDKFRPVADKPIKVKTTVVNKAKTRKPVAEKSKKKPAKNQMSKESVGKTKPEKTPKKPTPKRPAKKKPTKSKK